MSRAVTLCTQRCVRYLPFRLLSSVARTTTAERPPDASALLVCGTFARALALCDLPSAVCPVLCNDHPLALLPVHPQRTLLSIRCR